MSRDGKRLPLSSSCAALPYFLLCAFVVLPLTVGVLLPLLLVHTIIFKLLGLCGIGRARRDKASAAGDRENALLPTGDSAPAAATSAASVAVAVANAPAAANRVHDIVLFGATGFTGKLAAQYLAARYSGKDSNVHWAIAGRRAAALESLRAELQLSELPIIIADATDGASLAAMAASAKVVLATAGPFALHGSEVVRACAEAGTHYCDITGETDWVRQMIDRFDDTAKRTGSTIVHFCGHDCVPWDLSVLACADHLRAAGDAQLARISCYDSIVFWRTFLCVYERESGIDVLNILVICLLCNVTCKCSFRRHSGHIHQLAVGPRAVQEPPRF